jgi:hypothetical protein
MSYVINRFDGQAISTIEDGTVDQTLDIKLIGKNYAGYGELQNENFLHMLENFASSSPPPRAIRGQLWYDVPSKKIKFYTGEAPGGVKVFKTAGGVEYGTTAPLGATEGDQWFDSGLNQLKIRTASDWLVVGPQTAGAGTTQLVSRQVRGTDANLYSIIAATIGGTGIEEVTYIISKAEFTLDNTTNPIAGYTVIKKGMTLPNTVSVLTEGQQVTSSAHRFWGISAAAQGIVDSLGNFVSGAKLKEISEGTNNTLVNFSSDDGLTVGLGQDLAVYIDPDDQQTPVYENQSGPKLTFRARQAGIPKDIAVIDATTLSLSPGTDSTFFLGTNSKKWANIYSNTFTGTATQAATLQVGVDLFNNPVFRQASTAATANTVACRDSSGNITATIFNGTATTARYADLAEKYLADAEYEAGTVVCVGGEKEVTAVKFGERAIGVVSTAPAYMMNSELDGGTYIALKGRVPCKVVGAVRKGQRLVASDNGSAIAAGFHQHTDVFGIALESSDDVGVKKIEVLVL